jgi:integrase
MPRRKKPWNKGKIIGRKPPLTPEQVATIRTLLSQEGNPRDIAMFCLAIDSSLRGVDIVALNVSDVFEGWEIKERVTIEQSKTRERVTFALRGHTRKALQTLIEVEDKAYGDPLFVSQKGNKGRRLAVGQYRRLVKKWIELARLDPALYGSHSLRRTRVAHIYRKTANLRVAQVLLGHKSIENTARYLGIEEEQAMEIAEQFEI